VNGPVPDAIQWHEGMLLAPQHFQQLVQRQDALLHYQAGLLWPFHWGVRHLRIDAVRLGEGTLRVIAIEAVMPDGLVVAHDAASAGDLEVDLTVYAEALKSGPVTVHLAVPARRPGLSPVKGDLPRFESVEGEPVADESTGEGDLRVPRLRPRLTLLVADNPPQKYVSFPLARVGYANETFAGTEHLPPLLGVPLASPLGELCTGISRRLREKALFLSEQARSPAVASRPPQLLETRAMVQSLVAALPHFEAVLNTGVAHPYALYLALTWLVGHLAGISRGLLPPVLDPYDHNDPWTSFARARDFVFRVVDEGILESFTAFPFYLEKGVFNLTFDEDWRTRRLVLGVRAQPGASDGEAAAWMQQCLIGSKSRMPGLRDRRILGAKRERIDSDGDLVPSTGVALFALEADPEIVEPNQILQIWNAGDRGEPRASEVVLYVKNRR
jgi:type VI secretion system protein ImpJ